MLLIITEKVNNENDLIELEKIAIFPATVNVTHVQYNVTLTGFESTDYRTTTMETLSNSPEFEFFI